MQRAAVARFDRGAEPAPVQSFDIGRDVVKALRAQEVPVARVAHALRQQQVVAELRVGAVGLEAEIPAAALRVEAAAGRDRLGQRRFSRAVLPHEERHSGVERQLRKAAHRRDGKRIPVKIRHPLAPQRDFAEVLFLQAIRPPRPSYSGLYHTTARPELQKCCLLCRTLSGRMKLPQQRRCFP